MTESQILNTVSVYFKEHGYVPKRVVAKKLLIGQKSPDFEIYYSGELDYYCEVKSPLLLINNKTQLFQWTTTISKLRNFIQSAVLQFTDMDSDHNKPWVLLFTSDHMQLNWTNMTHAITGIVGYGQTIIRDLREYVKDSEIDLKKIDMFIWFQMNQSTDIHQVRFFINAGSKFKRRCENIQEKLRPVAGEVSFNN